MIWDTLPALAAGRPVLSTVRLIDFGDPRPCDDDGCGSLDHDTHMAAHPAWIPFTRWTQLTEFEYGEVLMDEVTGVASSRESHRMPGPVLNHLMQLRRADVTLRWSAPSWRRADTGIREVTQAVTLCKGFVKKVVPVAEGELERVWHHRRLFMWRTYDAYQFEDFTASMTTPNGTGQKARLKALRREWHWGPGSPAFDAYDTFDAVLSIGSVTESGRCMVCDGRRSAAPCTCPDYERPARSRRVSPVPSPAGSPRSGVAGVGVGGPDVVRVDLRTGELV